MVYQHNDTEISNKEIILGEVILGNEVFYKISHVDAMRPFFMSIVSNSNHWLFMASNGGISAGRKNSEYALFPYYTDDKITEGAESTGSKTIFRIAKNAETTLWEPFSIRGQGRFKVQRNLYKNKPGNKIIFEEINFDLNLGFQYEWNTSSIYGFVRKARLANLSGEECAIQLLDGLQNILPYGVGSDLQTRTSNLADAYKRTQLVAGVGLGIYALSAIIVDKAEPAEALKANVAWSLGLHDATFLLSALQLDHFRAGEKIIQEEDVKAEKGAYFAVAEITLAPSEERQWMLVANVNQTQAAVISLCEKIKNDKGLEKEIINDINFGTEQLKQLVAAGDGIQCTADGLRDTRHFSNVLFNIMRGGIFDQNYQIDKPDFENYLQKANCKLFHELQTQLQLLPAAFSVFELKNLAEKTGNIDFTRLATEYLPLKFSRRHGDPSRPWNQFSINTNSETDGSKILDYQGNWRDIFQNWEALAPAYPAFMEGMIFKFLNASTFEGYNPYRVTKDGFDWETIEPDNPWSYIGYWGDHQVIYLLKFLEFAEQSKPGTIEKLLGKNGFVYANVPYKIKQYEDILHNPKNTIEFDHRNDLHIRERINNTGSDGALLTDAKGEVYHVNFIEKILATLLSKLSNFVPDGGIWMNTQRPEWNDANNALVGNGLSMVTLYYLTRFLKFFQTIFQKTGNKEFTVSAELQAFFTEIFKAYQLHSHLTTTSVSPIARKQLMDALGMAAGNYRNRIYTNKFSGKKEQISVNALLGFVNVTLQFMEHSIGANKRADGLYHAYNLLTCNEDGAHISYLDEMLEGQVAVLSSGYIAAEESANLLDALKKSALYRPDQSSYILYPNKALPKFLEKNIIPSSLAERSLLLQKMLHAGDVSIVEQDVHGSLHFNGNFKNSGDLQQALTTIGEEYRQLAGKEKNILLQIFEEVFQHKKFTGRSGTFYGYEGLGSIYWHMVSKLLLAVQEICNRAVSGKTEATVFNRLAQHFYEINEGIGVHKPPPLYGAFPTDPYSHTPLNKGAQQPGMTGQVKEDILARMGELGVKMKDGKLGFDPRLLRRSEFLQKETNATFILADGSLKNIVLEPDSLAFTVCQVPIIYKPATANKIEVHYTKGTHETFTTSELNDVVSSKLYQRTGEIDHLRVEIDENTLR